MQEKWGWVSDIDHAFLIRSSFEVCPPLGLKGKCGPVMFGFSSRKMWIPPFCPIALLQPSGFCSLGMPCLLFSSVNVMQQSEERKTNYRLYKEEYFTGVGGGRSRSLKIVSSFLVCLLHIDKIWNCGIIQIGSDLKRPSCPILAQSRDNYLLVHLYLYTYLLLLVYICF